MQINFLLPYSRSDWLYFTEWGLGEFFLYVFNGPIQKASESWLYLAFIEMGIVLSVH